MKEGIDSLWKNEDYWAIWFGFTIMIGAILHWIPKIPKVGSWSANPLDAFTVVKDGVVTGTTIGPLLLLLLGLAVLTAIGVAFMKTDKVWKYLAGFVGVFILSCIAYWLAHQTNVKYWGLSYAMWAPSGWAGRSIPPAPWWWPAPCSVPRPNRWRRWSR